MFSTDLIHIIFFFIPSLFCSLHQRLNAALLRLLFVLFLINNNSTNEPNTTKKKRRKRANAHEFFHGNEKCHHKNYQLNRKTQKKRRKVRKNEPINFCVCFHVLHEFRISPKTLENYFRPKKTLAFNPSHFCSCFLLVSRWFMLFLYLPNIKLFHCVCAFYMYSNMYYVLLFQPQTLLI